jgi:metal-responsive CopG/Arc/MetJ family transcriptional regulator
MRRIHLFLKDRQIKSLQGIAKRDEASVAELVRTAIDSYLAKREKEQRAKP